MSRLNRILLILVFPVIIFSVLSEIGAQEQLNSGAGQNDLSEPVRFFENRIRPLLAEHCLKCHGPVKQWAGLRLDSRESLLKGGDSGAAVIPGNADESLIIQAVRHEDENLKMPQDSKLSDSEIDELVQWVKLGVPFPETVARSGRTRDPEHWAFQAFEKPPVPAVQNANRAANELDHFIMSPLEQAGIVPAPEADRRTLIRRLTYDLTGLPPTPQEVQEFLADTSADAWPRLIDRLLDSAAYGEHWGRHWLDVARYADSNGLDENIAHGNAWRYRDYVVSSVNSDKPIDRFILEQLAGDLLPSANEAERRHYATATGFLAIGPKVLAEVNQTKMQMDIVDEQLDTFGRVFLGMTFGCARCHDHKFDPIDTTDYYALAGIFKSTRTMDTYTKVAKWHEHEFPTPEFQKVRTDYENAVASKKKQIESTTAEAELKTLREELAELEKNPPEVPSAMGVTEDTITDLAVHIRGNPLRLGDVVARRTPPVVQGSEAPVFPATESGRRQLADWLTHPKNPLTSRVFVNRVWRWHFGRGLVRTTDNFGITGEQPSHPELLNWLACRFVEDGWSLKKLHRLILTSATWRQSAAQTAEMIEKDPENRLFGRTLVRRLNAEETRDSMLQVAGQLDRTMGGSLLKVKNRGYLFDHTSIDLTDYSSQRRSMYLPVIRNNVYDMFQLLDFPDPALPTGDRATTTVAPQALLMMNSDFVMQCADGLADRVLKDGGSDMEKLQQLYWLTFGREPGQSELTADTMFLADIEKSLPDSDPGVRRQKSWSVLCHVMLASNEFLYIQ